MAEELRRVPAEVAQRTVTRPDGLIEPAWVVSAIEEGGASTVIFAGVDAAERATTYARANYHPCHFRIMAEPGEYFQRGSSIGTANDRQSHN